MSGITFPGKTGSRETNKAILNVPTGLYWQSRFFDATAPFWCWLSGVETSILGEELEGISVTKPIYVTSLARSGTTILTEMLAQHPEISCHRYSDFPSIWTPYWRNWLLERSRNITPPLEERAHGDRIKVNNDSPEAFEEVLWNHFFSGLHDDSRSNELGPEHLNAAFNRLYTDHIRKLLRVRNASRYLAKGNYNISRIAYLLHLFPDARFLVPVRHPVNHIASLVKQQRLFVDATTKNPRVGQQLAFSGHWEFGLNRRFVHLGDATVAEEITQAWKNGNEVLGWAHYWNSTFRYLAKLKSRLGEKSKQIFVFRYEDFCLKPEIVIPEILQHADLDQQSFESIQLAFSKHLSLPEYYQPNFSDEEMFTIKDICWPVAEELGY